MRPGAARDARDAAPELTTLDPASVGLPIVAASVSLIVIAMVAARVLGLGVERSIGWASIRAAVQLMAVGGLLSVIVGSDLGRSLALGWILVMIGITVWTIRRRTDAAIPGVTLAAGLAVSGSVGASLAITFGLGVFDATPINLIVIAGITIGNALPSTVLAVDQTEKAARARRGEIEAMLALGFDRSMIGRELAPSAAKSSLIPQIERTKVVGLIALPGAMVGLLLAGADPIEAVIVQLLVMYLVLGSVAISVLAVVATSARRAVTVDLRIASWIDRDRS